jgi:hypothetical protein
MPATQEGPAEHVRRVEGVLRIGCRCDACNVPMCPNDPVVCWSVWNDCQQQIEPWEHEYLIGTQAAHSTG